MNNHCTKFQQQLLMPPHTPAEQEQLRLHLEECRECQEFARMLEILGDPQTATAENSTVPPLPPQLDQETLAACQKIIREERPAFTPPSRRRWFFYHAAAAAAVLLLLGYAFFGSLNESHNTTGGTPRITAIHPARESTATRGDEELGTALQLNELELDTLEIEMMLIASGL